MDVREIHAGLLKDTAVTQYPTASAAAAFALPLIFLKRTAVNLGQFLANLVLQL